MKNKIIMFAFLACANWAFACPHSDCEHPKIVTSTTPIASIVKTLIGDNANVVAIDDGSSGCPHHYHMRPSDKEKTADARMLIYIDDNFDGFAKHLLTNFSGKIIKISGIDSINFIGADGKMNWHFWLDLQNILALQSAVSDALIEEFPEFKSEISANKMAADEKIKSLMELKSNELNDIGELVLMSDSLEHFFTGVDAKIIRLYQKSNASLQSLKKLEKLLSAKTPQCIVLDSEQDPKLYEKYNKKIVQLESENWSVSAHHHHDHDEHEHDDHEHHHDEDNSELFYNKYREMIRQLQNCR
jgi:zinc transport system substrate-binding protein